jgi:hypothetical protein
LLETGDLLVEALELLLGERLPLERSASQVLPPGAKRGARLFVELRQLDLELLRLELEPLLCRHDVGDALLHLLEHLALLLVRVVERDRGILCAVEQLRDPSLDDVRRTAHQPHVTPPVGSVAGILPRP